MMTIKMSLAGAGYIAEIHAKAVKKQAGTELVTVVEKFPE
jgi:hypothetical protein